MTLFKQEFSSNKICLFEEDAAESLLHDNTF